MLISSLDGGTQKSGSFYVSQLNPSCLASYNFYIQRSASPITDIENRVQKTKRYTLGPWRNQYLGVRRWYQKIHRARTRNRLPSCSWIKYFTEFTVDITDLKNNLKFTPAEYSRRDKTHGKVWPSALVSLSEIRMNSPLSNWLEHVLTRVMMQKTLTKSLQCYLFAYVLTSLGKSHHTPVVTNCSECLHANIEVCWFFSRSYVTGNGHEVEIEQPEVIAHWDCILPSLRWANLCYPHPVTHENGRQ